MIESKRLELLSGEVKYITIPSNSGMGQKVARWPESSIERRRALVKRPSE